MTIRGSGLRRRLLCGLAAAAPVLTILASGGLAASPGEPPAAQATGQKPAQAGPAASTTAPAAPATAPAAPATAPPKPATAPPKPATAPAATAAAPPKPKNLEPLQSAASSGILGKKVTGPDGKELGLIVDVVVAADGHPLAAIIDFGGFLGVGSRKIAIDWRLLRFDPGQPDWQVALRLSRAEVQAAPEYKPDAATNQMVGPPWEAPASRNGEK
jgi:pyruvate/2-oxoglutarate dehydrogenase complex dihydrolipoamide acyltransferase (E2) component